MGPWEKYGKAGPWTKYAEKAQPEDAKPVDPTEGMSGFDKFAAGAGKAVVDLGRGAQQLAANLPGSDLLDASVDKISGALGIERKTSLADERQAIQNEIDESRRLDAPLMNTGAGKWGNVAGNVLASIATSVVPGANTATGAAAIGTALGALQPTVEGESRATNTLIGGGAGLAGYGVGKAIGSGIASAKQKAASAQTVPSLDDLHASANQAYAKAENAGLVISEKSFSNFVNRVQKSLQDEGIDPTLHPKATAALKRLSDATENPLSLREIDTLRRVVKGAASSIERDERRIARIMTDQLDDYVSSLKRVDVVVGKDKVDEATSALTEARGLWSKFRKGEVIEDLIERAENRAAQFSGSGKENALRTEFRQLAQNPKRMRLFSETERKAIQRVARGGPLENALRFIGKFAPTGTISTFLTGGAGYAIGGPVGSAALMGAGAAGRMGAKALTGRNARIASEVMRSGGDIPVNPGFLTLQGSRLTALESPQFRLGLGLVGPSIYAGQQ